MNLTHLLSFSIWTPIFLGGLILLLSGKMSDTQAKWLSLVSSVISFLITIPLYTAFDFSFGQFQFQEFFHWIPAFHINYHLGVDGFAVPLILLTSFTTVIVVMASWRSIQDRVAQYMAAFLIMSGLMIGVFSALDAMLYYIFWEAMLIPMFLVIGIWGGPNRIYATIKFFLYTVLGSLLMLVAFIYLYLHTHSFEVVDFYNAGLGLYPQIFIFLAFFMAFAVKIPMWPLHTWLPDAHVEAPTGGSVVLAAVMLKLGAYSFMRFAMPIAPEAAIYLKDFMVTLSLIAILYIALIAIVQKDMKKLIAYSSISHMGFVTLGLFMFNAIGIEGAYVQMISHGFISAAENDAADLLSTAQSEADSLLNQSAREAAQYTSAAKRDAQKLISDAAKNIVDYRSWLSSAISEADRLHRAQNASLNAAENAIAESRQKLKHAFDRLAQLQADINANLDSENNPTGKVFIAGAGKKAAAAAARKKQVANKKSAAVKKKKK